MTSLQNFGGDVSRLPLMFEIFIFLAYLYRGYVSQVVSLWSEFDLSFSLTKNTICLNKKHNVTAVFLVRESIHLLIQSHVPVASIDPSQCHMYPHTTDKPIENHKAARH